MAGTIERLDRLSGGPCQLSAVPHRPLDMTIRPGRKDSSLHLILFWSIQKTGIADAIFYFLFDAVSRSRSPLILSSSFVDPNRPDTRPYLTLYNCNPRFGV